MDVRVVQALCAVLALGCEERRTHEITITDGVSTVRFSTQVEFAEYLELPGDHNELRLTVAGYPASCENWVAPADGQEAVTVVIVTPPDVPVAPGTFAWSGIPPADEPIRTAYALPKAHHGQRSRLFEPGGSIRLTKVQLDAHGSVAGVLSFEFPGESDRPATRVDGNFEARLCRLSTATR